MPTAHDSSSATSTEIPPSQRVSQIIAMPARNIPARRIGNGNDCHGRIAGQIYDLDLAEHRTTLTRVLQDQSRQKRVAMMAPEPPADFVQRPSQFEALKQKLLDPKGDAVAIAVALRGAGG
jgi:hypothetical protein